jgi:hypothetical protein
MRQRCSTSITLRTCDDSNGMFEHVNCGVVDDHMTEGLAEEIYAGLQRHLDLTDTCSN